MLSVTYFHAKAGQPRDTTPTPSPRPCAACLRQHGSSGQVRTHSGAPWRQGWTTACALAEIANQLGHRDTNVTAGYLLTAGRWNLYGRATSVSCGARLRDAACPMASPLTMIAGSSKATPSALRPSITAAIASWTARVVSDRRTGEPRAGAQWCRLRSQWGHEDVVGLGTGCVADSNWESPQTTKRRSGR